MSFILGAHMSISKGFSEAARKTSEIYSANAMQIFTKNPRGRGAKPILKEIICCNVKVYFKEKSLDLMFLCLKVLI